MSFENLKTYFDSRQFPTDAAFEYDLCIIGSGPAGISIAREFSNTNTRVVVLESGGLWFEEDINDLNTLTATGHYYPEKGTRLRMFGGTANHWGGHCAPMTPSSFEKRDWIAYSGWPFGIGELNPYYARAHDIIEIGPYDYRCEPTAERLGMKLLPFDPNIVQTQMSRYHSQNFGPRYAKELDKAEDVSVFLYATVTSINLDEHKRFVSDVEVRTLAGNRFDVRAKIFVLATGGIENARILLLSNRDMAHGLGNQNDLVGRFFMDHIAYESGFIVPFDQDPGSVKFYADENYLEEDYDVRGNLVLSDRCLRELQIPEYRVEMEIGYSRKYLPSTRSAANFESFLETFRFEFLSLRDLMNVASDVSSPLEYLMGDKGAPLIYGFANNCEQCPNPASRVRLSEKKDAFGQNMTELNWQLCELDIEGIRKAQRVIAREVGRTGIGRMNIFMSGTSGEMPAAIRGIKHHMGTTRMHADPKQGVVDADCRIHGIENIFVAGSSVFPSGGYPNPTLTLTALAVRLADHLKIKFAGL